MECLHRQRAIFAVNKVPCSFEVSHQTLWAAVSGVGVVHLPPDRWLLPLMVNDDGALIQRVTQIGIQNRPFFFHDVSHVVYGAHSKGVVARANLAFAIVGGLVGKQPGDPKEQGEESKPCHDRHDGSRHGGSQPAKHLLQCAKARRGSASQADP